ncbi:hypothetical protein ACQY0O_001031 [Thecaphora frezii]
MALHQLFTLAFALQLEPLPTLDYVAAHHNIGQEPSSDSLRVGANAFLEPIVSRHSPHPVQTISFLLQYTKALEAVEPWSELISLLAQADHDPKFKNLRHFFDARYDADGKLVGAELQKKPSSPTKRLRSASRSTAFASTGRRGSQATDARKPSFAQSIGGAAALRLNWLRKNSESQAVAFHGDFSDDEEQSSHSHNGSLQLPLAYTAPELRVAIHPGSGTAEMAAMGPSPGRSEAKALKAVRFTVRLDLHNVGLAPRPPRSQRRRSDPASSRRGSNPSETSSDGNAVLAGLHGGQDLTQVASPTSTRSGGEADGFGDDAAGAPHVQNGMSSQPYRKGSMTSVVGSSGGKGPRRPSMIAKLLDFGLRKRSNIDRSDAHEGAFSSDDGSLHSQSDAAGPAPTAKRIPSGLSHLRADAGRAESHPDDEALDDAEEDNEPALNNPLAKATSLIRPQGMPTLLARRRSSNGSSGRAGPLQGAISVEPDLGPVREDGAFEVFDRVTTCSSTDARSASALGDSEAWKGMQETQDRALSDGKDFISLLRTACELTMSLTEVEAARNTAEDGETPVATPRNETDAKQLSDKAQGKLPDASGTTTPNNSGPQVRPKTSSIPSTPSRSLKSLELDRSSDHLQLADGRESGADNEKEAWWPCGEVDPLPVSISCALGKALGWEGIMQLCYGPGSRSAMEGSYAPLGRAAAMDEASKRHERTVLAWRTGVASVDPAMLANGEDGLPPLDGDGERQIDPDDLSKSLNEQLSLGAEPALPRLEDEGAARNGDRGGHAESNGTPANGSSGYAPPTLRDLLGYHSEDGRTWEDWMNLFQSIQGWVREYETTRVRAGLAHEIGVEPEPRSPSPETAEEAQRETTRGTSHGSSPARSVTPHRADSTIMPEAVLQLYASPQQLQSATSFGSPESAPGPLGRAVNGNSGSLSSAHVTMRRGCEAIPGCVVKDITNRKYGFRRRAGIPEGLPAGPNGEEFEDYSWSRQKLDHRHFATAMTIGGDSFSHILMQLHGCDWIHASAWELDYLEMCVFKSPLVAERFPAPGSAIVPAARSYHPAEGAQDRTKPCPNPDQDGCWSSAEWKRWLSTIKEGDIIVPAIGWQAWWTLISVLNGADGSGRTYDLQVKTPEEPFEALTDLSAVYI